MTVAGRVVIGAADSLFRAMERLLLRSGRIMEPVVQGAPRSGAAEAGSEDLTPRVIAGVMVGIVMMTMLWPPLLPSAIGGTASIFVLYRRSRPLAIPR